MRAALPLRLALPLLEPFLAENVAKEARKDALIVRRAGEAVAAGAPADYEVIRTPTHAPATPAEPSPGPPPVVSPAGTVPARHEPQSADTSAAESARDRACVDALYQFALLGEKRRAYRPGPGGTRTYLEDDARPAELERLARERDANCSDEPATRSSQERRAVELAASLSPDCQTSRGKLELMLDAATRTPESEVERQRDYLKEHCPGEDRSDLWMADWMVVHPRRH